MVLGLRSLFAGFFFCFLFRVTAAAPLLPAKPLPRNPGCWYLWLGGERWEAKQMKTSGDGLD
ncbi:MAG: hypothetical protein ACXWU3_17510, partial [Allosphingosinicella sp.]